MLAVPITGPETAPFFSPLVTEPESTVAFNSQGEVRLVPIRHAYVRIVFC